MVSGVLFLAGALRLADRRPARTLALGTALGGAMFLTARTPKSGLALAVAAAGLTVWVATDRFAGRGVDPPELVAAEALRFVALAVALD